MLFQPCGQAGHDRVSSQSHPSFRYGRYCYARHLRCFAQLQKLLRRKKLKGITAGLLFAMSVFLVSMQPSLAQSSMSSSGSMMTMPKCASGDSVVGVNMTTKMYMTQTQMKAKTAGMSMAQKEAMMKKNNVKMMCKSQATAMGAKMMATPPM